MKKLGVVLGIVFVLVGILGFISNPLVGANGLFQTDAVHNVIHLIIGVVLLIAAKSESASRKAIITFAVIYLLLAIVGFFQLGASGQSGKLLGLASANSADNWLHVVLAIVMYVLVLIVGKKSAGAAPAQQM